MKSDFKKDGIGEEVIEVLTDIRDALRETKAPVVEVAAPVVNVPAPVVNVAATPAAAPAITLPKHSWRFKVERDRDGLITTITANPI